MLFICSSISVYAVQKFKHVPPKIQAVIFKKILSYSKNLKNSDIRIYVLVDNSIDEKDTLIESFSQLGINIVEIKQEKLTQVEKSSVLYVFSSNKKVREYCNQNNILCLSGDPDDVVNNKAAISLFAENNKPKIIINSTVLSEEEHEFSSDLLKLAKIVGE